MKKNKEKKKKKKKRREARVARSIFRLSPGRPGLATFPFPFPGTPFGPFHRNVSLPGTLLASLGGSNPDVRSETECHDTRTSKARNSPPVSLPISGDGEAKLLHRRRSVDALASIGQA
jgi:hypothetical protein